LVELQRDCVQLPRDSGAAAGRPDLRSRDGHRRRVLPGAARGSAAGGAGAQVKVTALAAHTPEAVRAALAARGWETQPAWVAATGIQPPGVPIEDGARLTADGARLLDVGGESPRPGATPVPAKEEIARIVPVIRGLVARGVGPVSVDTRKAEVARAALEAGAAVVNDVSGLRFDAGLAAVARDAGAGVILMHIRGTPATMDHLAKSAHVGPEVAAELAAMAAMAEGEGIPRERIVIDPGFGFAKTATHNFRLLDELATVVALGYPVAVGLSRKRFLGASTGRPVEDRDRATALACALAWERGARLFRVHDVALTREALALASATTTPP